MTQLREADIGASLFRSRFASRSRRDGDALLSPSDDQFAIDELSRIITDRCPDATAWDLDPEKNVIHVRFATGKLLLEPDRLDPYDAPVVAAIQALRRSYPLAS
jgi:hypothetical protein